MLQWGQKKHLLRLLYEDAKLEHRCAKPQYEWSPCDGFHHTDDKNLCLIGRIMGLLEEHKSTEQPLIYGCFSRYILTEWFWIRKTDVQIKWAVICFWLYDRNRRSKIAVDQLRNLLRILRIQTVLVGLIQQHETSCNHKWYSSLQGVGDFRGNPHNGDGWHVHAYDDLPRNVNGISFGFPRGKPTIRAAIWLYAISKCLG